MRIAGRSRWTIIALAIVVIAGVLLAAGCGGPKEAEARYHCPMHPTYISDRPGDCPICGMRLVPITPVAPSPAPAATADATPPASGTAARTGDPTPPAAPTARRVLYYRNPMNPSVTSPVPMKDQMGMDYVPVYTPEVAAPTPGPPHAILYYRSPMNPEITSPVPMKDPMGMDYVPVYADEVAAQPGGSVPGLAPVQLTDEGIRLAGVQTAPAVRELLGRSIRTVGIITADETRIRHVHTKITGWVEKLFVDFTGQAVRQGQPILSLYSPELLASQEEFLRARDNAARFASSDLPEVRRGGEELVTAARRRLRLFDVPEAFIEQLERTGQVQRDVTLLAPVSGYVTAKETFEGQQVDPGMELFAVTDLSRIWVEADFYEYEAQPLRLGEEAAVTLPYDPGTRLTGRIAYIYPTLNPESRTLKVRFEFPNPRLALKPGMFANVELTTAGAEGVVIPDSAIIDTGERKVVFVAQGGGRFEPRLVQVGVRTPGRAEILSGVSAGEQVVVRANFLLDSESQLRAIVAAPPPTPGTANRAQGTEEKRP